MKLLVDMNLSPDWVEALSKEGFEAIHWSSVGKPSAPDREIMAWAAAHGFVLLTHDLDFAALLAATSATGPSVVQLRGNDTLPDVALRRVVTAIRQSGGELAAGAVASVDLERARVRTLPLK